MILIHLYKLASTKNIEEPRIEKKKEICIRSPTAPHPAVTSTFSMKTTCHCLRCRCIHPTPPSASMDLPPRKPLPQPPHPSRRIGRRKSRLEESEGWSRTAGGRGRRVEGAGGSARFHIWTPPRENEREMREAWEEIKRPAVALILPRKLALSQACLQCRRENSRLFSGRHPRA